MDRIEGVFGALLDEIVSYVDEHTSVHIVGPRGSGRSEVLGLAADRLDDAGLGVLRIYGNPAWCDEPYAALYAAGISPPAPSGPGVPRRPVADMLAALGQQLRGGPVVVVDDADDLDQHTVGVLLAARRRTPFAAVTTSRMRHPIAPASLLLGLPPAVRIEAPILGLEEVHGLTRSLLDGPVEAGLLTRIAMMSGGLHGLVCAMVSVGRSTGRLVRRDGVWTAPDDLWTPHLAAAVEPFLAGADRSLWSGATTLALTGPVPLADAEKLIERSDLDRLFTSGLVHHTLHHGDTVVGVYPPLLAEFLRREGSAFGLAQARDQAGPGAERFDPIDMGGADAAVLNERLVRGTADRAAWAWEVWDGAPTAENALELIAALRATAAPAAEVEAVIERTDLAGDRTDAAAKFVATVATWRAVDGNDLPGALAYLDQAGSALLPDHATMMRATRAHLVFLRDRIPDDDLTIDAAAEAEEGGAEWLTNVQLEVLIASGRVEEARRLLDGFQPRRGSGTFQAALCDGLVDVLAGELESGIEKADRHLHVARRAGDPRAIQGHSYVELLGLTLAGRLGDAADVLYRTMSAARVAAFRETFHTGVLVLGSEIALSRGRVLRSRTLAEQALANDRGTGPFPGMDPSVFVGDDDDPAALGAKIWELVADRVERGYAASAVLLATQAVGRLPDRAAAERIRDVAVRLEGRLLPAVGRYVDAAARADADELGTAIADFRDIGALFFAVRAAVARAIALRAQDRTTEAAAQADEAWVMSSVAGQERSGMFRPLVDDIALSPREVEIAEMVARPMTTAEVAGALQMSVRTVETHLHNVGRKIGTSGRDPLVRAITTWLRPAGA